MTTIRVQIWLPVPARKMVLLKCNCDFYKVQPKHWCTFLLYIIYFCKRFYVKGRFHKAKGDMMFLINYAQIIFCHLKNCISFWF